MAKDTRKIDPEQVVETPRPGKRVSASRSEMTEVVLPQDANPLGNILGGRVMHLMDIAAAIAAHRHSNSYVVTASVDYVDFRNPIRVGELIILKSSSADSTLPASSKTYLTGSTSSGAMFFKKLSQDGSTSSLLYPSNG